MIGQALEIEILKNLSLDMHQGINTVTENVEYLESGIPILQSKHITKGFLNLEDTKYLSEKDYLKYKDKYQANIDDVLVCNIGTIGKSLRINKAEKFLIAWNLFLIKLDNTKLYSQYFAHYLNHLSDQNYFDKFLTGGTVKFINKKTMGNIQVPLLPLPQQQKIANILDAADALRQNDKALIAKYDELTQALFLDMFGDPVSNPKGWEKVSGKKVFKLVGGAAFKSTDYISTGLPLIRIGTVNKGCFDNSQLTFLPKSFEESHSRYIVYPNDLLITLTGTVGKDDYGNAFALTNEYEKYLLNQRVAKICSSDNYNLVFLKFFIKQKKVKNELIGVSRGVRQANLSNEDFYKLEVINPPIELQNQFTELVADIEEQKVIAQKSLEKSEELFNSLLQKAFKGELV